MVLYSAYAMMGIIALQTVSAAGNSMSNASDYKNHPLNGVSLKNLLIDLVDHYGFEILFAYLNINCFKTNPSVESSVKFLKKTEWAREKVEGFYLYQYKNLPRASAEQFALPPRDRVIPPGQSPGEPAVLSLEDAQRLREKRAKKAAERSRGAASGAAKRSGGQKGSRANSAAQSAAEQADADELKPGSAAADAVDPWANWKNKPER